MWKCFFQDWMYVPRDMIASTFVSLVMIHISASAMWDIYWMQTRKHAQVSTYFVSAGIYFVSVLWSSFSDISQSPTFEASKHGSSEHQKLQMENRACMEVLSTHCSSREQAAFKGNCDQRLCKRPTDCIWYHVQVNEVWAFLFRFRFRFRCMFPGTWLPAHLCQQWLLLHLQVSSGICVEHGSENMLT